MTIAIVVTRPLMFRCERVETGAVLRVSADEAVGLLESGRAELRDPTDRAEVKAAAVDAVKRTMANARVPMPHPGSPWTSWSR